MYLLRSLWTDNDDVEHFIVNICLLNLIKTDAQEWIMWFFPLSLAILSSVNTSFFEITNWRRFALWAFIMSSFSFPSFWEKHKRILCFFAAKDKIRIHTFSWKCKTWIVVHLINRIWSEAHTNYDFCLRYVYNERFYYALAAIQTNRNNVFSPENLVGKTAHLNSRAERKCHFVMRPHVARKEKHTHLFSTIQRKLLAMAISCLWGEMQFNAVKRNKECALQVFSFKSKKTLRLCDILHCKMHRP